MRIKLGNGWELEVLGSAWDPSTHIEFAKHVYVSFRDEETGEWDFAVYVNICLLCISLEVTLEKVVDKEDKM